jgi:hypothetical protein
MYMSSSVDAKDAVITLVNQVEEATSPAVSGAVDAAKALVLKSPTVVTSAASSVAAALASTPGLSPLQSQFITLVLDLLQNKPQTQDDAIALYHAVTVQLGTCLVSELPPLEQKAALMAIWAVSEVSKMGAGCFSFLKR